MPDTGAPWFIPYVENTDLVSDWPTDSLALANAIVAALEDIPVTQKKIEAFTASGTWTVPAGVTYAIAHIRGGGGGINAGATPGGTGGTSSVAFAGGTATADGGVGVIAYTFGNGSSNAGPANSGHGATGAGTTGGNGWGVSALDGALIVHGDDVTPAASITVTVGGGGTTTNGATGGSGYVYIEYYEEV